jgi:phage shock protein E
MSSFRHTPGLAALALTLACNSGSAPAAAPAAPGAPAAPTVATLAAEKDVLYLDVRSPAEFSAGHVEGAVNVPVGDTAKMAELIGRKDRPVIVHCAVGGRAGQATAALKAQGFTRLVNGGGYKDVAATTGKAVVQ